MPPNSRWRRRRIQLRLYYKISKIAMNRYISSAKDWVLRIVQARKRLNPILLTRNLQIRKGTWHHHWNSWRSWNHCHKLSKTDQAVSKKKKKRRQKQIEEPLHEQCILRSLNTDADQVVIHQWQRSSEWKKFRHKIKAYLQG